MANYGHMNLEQMGWATQERDVANQAQQILENFQRSHGVTVTPQHVELPGGRKIHGSVDIEASSLTNPELRLIVEHEHNPGTVISMSSDPRGVPRVSVVSRRHEAGGGPENDVSFRTSVDDSPDWAERAYNAVNRRTSMDQGSARMRMSEVEDSTLTAPRGSLRFARLWHVNNPENSPSRDFGLGHYNIGTGTYRSVLENE